MKLAFSSLPTRSLENYKYTDFSQLLSEWTEAEMDVDGNFSLPPDFLPLVESIKVKDTPLVQLALSYPCKKSSRARWKNELNFIRVKAGETSSFKIQPSPSDQFLNVFYGVILEKDAHLKIEVEVNPSLSRQIFTAQHIEVWQESDSTFEIFYANGGQAFGRYDLHSTLKGERACCRAFGFYQGEVHDHIDHHLWVEHRADHTKSEQFFKGTMNGHSHGVFNGKATVHEKVKQAEVRQHNFNLLLSPLAEINTKPELEVFTDVVSAAHGATVGQLDGEALFYLMSRGISDSAARQMLVDGFLQEVRERFKARTVS